MIGIYKITNMINGKVYIGLSTNIERRWKNHKKDAFWKNGKHYDYPLYRSMRKHGVDNFSFEVLEECKIADLNIREIHYIELYKSYDRQTGYNQDTGGTYARRGKLSINMVVAIRDRLRTTDESCKSIAEKLGLHENTILDINSGRTWMLDGESYPIRQPFSVVKKKHHERKLRVHACQHCGKEIVSNAKHCVECAQIAQRRAERPTPLKLAEMVKEFGFEATGKQFGVSGNTIKKWCKSYQIPHNLRELLEWYDEQTGEDSQLLKSIHQIDLQTGKIINTFESASAAEKHLSVGSNGNIIAVCKGKRKSAYGYFWKFA